MIRNDVFLNMINAPVRMFRGRVEFYEGSTLTLLCGCHDRLQEFTVERTGEGKFFGYGICQKINVKLRDTEREVNVTTANSLEVEFGAGASYIYPFPRFYVTEVHRDENTNGLSVTAYDKLYWAANHTVAELELTAPYSIRDFVNACGALLGLAVDTGELEAFNTVYDAGANFDGTETLRDALNAVAEATQTIYFINWDWVLTFKRLSNEAQVDLEITKEKYFSLDSGDNRRLATITHATELGDNVTASTTATGTTQYVRDNPFWDLREDIGALLNDAIAAVGGLTINKFSCEWRGNFLLEIGDKIRLTTKDNSNVVSYLLNDTLAFDGSLSQSTEWEYVADDVESEDSPTSLGDALKQTFARVDKANREIELVASEAANNAEAISALQLSTEGIIASVQKIEEKTSADLEGLSDEVATLTNKVTAAITSEDVRIQIETELANGVDKVTTTTGFTFNDEGLTVSKSGSEMETAITEDGMTVYRNEEAVLIADHEGVKAEDLHATTYLIIGTNSRFEDYLDNRTGCFWIGGNN